MNQQSVSILAILVNVLLTLGKILLGVFLNLTSLVAEGVHSGLDIISSAVAYLGIKSAQKPVDEKHPYGHYRAESLAGFIIVVLLALSAVWILYEGVLQFMHPEKPIFSIWALILMGASGLINEVMARLKFYVGAKFSSPALIADGEHSRADVVASFGVLIGIFLIKFYNGADAIVAILVGLYILWEAWQLSREITDSLLDVADSEIEGLVRDELRKDNVEIGEIKSRKIGTGAIVDLKVNLDPNLKIDQASQLISKLEKSLLDKIEKLRAINIAVTTHDVSRAGLKASLGGRFRYKGRGVPEIKVEKKGFRTIIPFGDGLSETFGAPYYMVIDKDKDGKIIKKEKVKNQFYEEGAGHGVRFAKAIVADKVIATEIHENAKVNLDASKIKYTIVSQDELKRMLDEK